MLFSIVAGLVYLIALTLPLFLLFRFRAAAWFLHALAVVAALAVGLSPGTPLLDTLPGTFIYGFVFVFLMTWGIGGLVAFRRRSERKLASSAS